MTGDDGEQRAEHEQHLGAEARRHAAGGIDARQPKAQNQEDGADADADRRIEPEQLRRDPAGIAARQRREQGGSGDEADLKQGLVSISSPIARALIGKVEGDIAEVQAPGGIKSYEITGVRYE